jgi:hypothetical protein
LADDLASGYQLTTTYQGAQGWLFEIKQNGLRSAGIYLKLVDIAYVIDESTASGTYQAGIKDIALTLSDHTVVTIDEITVYLVKGTTVGISSADNNPSVRYSNGALAVNTPASERIEIYSISGALLYSVQKPTGEAIYTISHLPKGILIVRGSSGWVKKIAK